jgi:phosphohistidine swiveling domain-containing protein
VLKDSKSLRSRVNKVKEVLMKINELTVKAVINGKKVGVPVVIGPRMLDQPASEIIRVSKDYLKK